MDARSRAHRSRCRHALAPALCCVLATVAAVWLAVAAGASTSHAGWPPDQHLIMDKGPAGLHHTLHGVPWLHNWILGGYGNDTIYGGTAGDVIWGDYHPSGWPSFQVAVVHGGDGRNVIYANDTVNYVWTGTDGATVVHAHEGSGVIHCQNPGIVVFTSHRALPHYRLDGCRRISFYSVGY
jgi:RTX calcium-binding nonapeptide repeat (4 copies)